MESNIYCPKNHSVFSLSHCSSTFCLLQFCKVGHFRVVVVAVVVVVVVVVIVGDVAGTHLSRTITYKPITRSSRVAQSSQ